MAVVNKRLANKVIWSLEDAIALCRDARRHWRAAMSEADRRNDYVTMAHLGKLRDALAQIDTKVKDARNGRYRE